MSSLPLFSAVLASSSDPGSPLAQALVILFEPSTTLYTHLLPQLAQHLPSANVAAYNDLIDASLHVISLWDDVLKAEFIAGHPRIGEMQNLSHLSSKEQAAVATPPEVLARLKYLNAYYEYRYPGLRYITFVNGRSRAMIKEEMEDVLGLPHSLDAREEARDMSTVMVGGKEWRAELERAVQEVGRIAKSRLSTLGASEEENVLVGLSLIS
ncbi:hypothetical protein EW026_g189 [Hermanssonia centrifuga]|uniref:Oxo-4-hydroxy-4-carboxy-5-ureidoimidazoline decarboxylase domain-containing protein n=1 Tax=Hermanssonia centrifuga TaxID=98765 RepID=A0A4S4KV69_9APHY|nr:hypothetical protein EW026_g189 [Hermanssonia centrifuga]